MRPNKTGIGKFKQGNRYLTWSPLFDEVSKIYAYFPKDPGTGLQLMEVAFLHDCGNTYEGLGYYINENGYCTNCGKFLAPHKKLEVMAALKELTG